MNIIVYILILFLAILGISDTEIVNSAFDIYLKVTSILLTITIITYLIIKRFDIFTNFSTLWFALQRFVGLTICNFPFISVNTFRKFFLIKEVMFIYTFFILITIFIIKKVKKIKFPLIFTDKILIAYCIILLLYTLLSPVNIWLKLLSLRRFIILPLIYFIGRMAVINFDKIKCCTRYTAIFTYIICIYGLIDYFFARSYIYRKLFSVDEYFSKQVLAGFIPAQWTTGDIMQGGIFTDYTFGVLPRFVTTFIEPTTLGSFLAFVFLFAVFGKGVINIKPLWIKHLLNLMLLLCIVLTFSKGAFTILLFGSAYILNQNKKIPKLIRKGYFYSVIGILCIGITLILVSRSGASAHINGLRTGIISSITHPFGLGLGNAGNFANLLGDNTGESIGTESAIGSMLGQLGIIGFIPYLLFIISSIKTLSKRPLSHSNLYIVMAGAFLGYSINSLFTDSALGVTGNFYYFLFTGLLITQIILVNKKRSKNNEKNVIYNT